ncbi:MULTISPECIES: hypothetical protein [unclassified Mesorhizobium]|uniref:hypothetical protein n=1 Tax=unclassified Mesorhizobium TaxID=325217 RepID=UPI00112A1482|nr:MULTISPECIES: hypothetical protein [unclassified Mesorhizobium]TPJ41011.1 hypothetical protein FJ437_25335 [Mesorhizobium sp. B2-6-6]MCA0008727.1 hypothetical protein [Mesorhizobium sp. B264B1B]MCA0019395.1 hypothetical protein [Mesorhizobium sp. B264B1A]MCA0024564.1 hypothetical protein [Mesorhizobium sp. B263B1A]MCA0055764.1 hypothetical protein [Mesorhizobium sp. B261B1A]
MRNSLFLLAALGCFSTFALPAAAESEEGSCAASSSSSIAPAGPIDLEAIPMQDATGPKAIKGVGDDHECDDSHTSSKAVFSSTDEDGQGDDD